jgi:hypothetical protein
MECSTLNNGMSVAFEPLKKGSDDLDIYGVSGRHCPVRGTEGETWKSQK